MIAGQGEFYKLQETNVEFAKLMKKYGVLEEEQKEEEVPKKNKELRAPPPKHIEEKDIEVEEEKRRNKGALVQVFTTHLI